MNIRKRRQNGAKLIEDLMMDRRQQWWHSDYLAESSKVDLNLQYPPWDS